MNVLQEKLHWFGGVTNLSPVTIIAIVLVVAGLLLGTTAHMGFMILFAVGAFGPGLLRQMGLIDDLDELQKEAAAKSGLRAYLVTAILMMAVVIGENWNRFGFGLEKVPASSVVLLMLIVYYASYCLSFWDTRKAVSRVLLAIGLFWLAFVVLSHAREPAALFGEALLVPGPFIVAAVLCRWFPRTVGLLLIALAMSSIYFFHMIRLGESFAESIAFGGFTLLLIPLPLTVAGVALIADGSRKGDEE